LGGDPGHAPAAAQERPEAGRLAPVGRLCLYGRRAERLHKEIVPLAARWIEPARRSGPLKAYAREAETRTLDLLEQSLTGRLDWAPPDVIRGRLLAAAPPDVEELLPQLEPRAEELAGLATRRLRERGEREARDLDETLRRRASASSRSLTATRASTSRSRWRSTRKSEVSQLQSNMRYWRMRLDQFDRDLEQEPGRIRAGCGSFASAVQRGPGEAASGMARAT